MHGYIVDTSIIIKYIAKLCSQHFADLNGEIAVMVCAIILDECVEASYSCVKKENIEGVLRGYVRGSEHDFKPFLFAVTMITCGQHFKYVKISA